MRVARWIRFLRGVDDYGHSPAERASMILDVFLAPRWPVYTCTDYWLFYNLPKDAKARMHSLRFKLRSIAEAWLSWVPLVGALLDTLHGLLAMREVARAGLPASVIVDVVGADEEELRAEAERVLRAYGIPEGREGEAIRRIAERVFRPRPGALDLLAEDLAMLYLRRLARRADGTRGVRGGGRQHSQVEQDPGAA